MNECGSVMLEASTVTQWNRRGTAWQCCTDQRYTRPIHHLLYVPRAFVLDK